MSLSKIATMLAAREKIIRQTFCKFDFASDLLLVAEQEMRDPAKQNASPNTELLS
jgi:hypothetical protein